ncbi:hypothetical protein PRIPAC_85522 [Pristionchus pacificus]|uniref:Uncharacterized protein n=1 Tax=Pristionchus pacificus TaxID=54126 RepID=A0A2A6BKV6_PRIPA|nr:hypothetical protein PRIPAC_85522 [Pristionchus pacificus]|eukprot:PDM66527.1 hypothetical protein PRIPAC_47944 [Pristionchus pacificus]
MLGKRKRKCFECGNADETTRTFPANSRTTLQKQWLDRLGLNGPETIKKYEEYREKLTKGVDIRWCTKHFIAGETLPIDLRSKPLLVTTHLREELQPQRLNERYRNPIVCTTPVASDNEMDMDEMGLSTPPRQSPIRSSSFPLLDPNDNLNDDYMNILPKRFKKEASIRVENQLFEENTISQESQGSQLSEYTPSQDVNHVSEEDTDYSDNEGNYEEGEAVKKKKKKYRLVGEDQLRSLFRRCQECGEVIDSSSLTIRSEGSACVVEFDCSNLSCKAGNWKSQERIGKGRSTVFEGNQEISIGAFISGVPIPRLVDFAKLLGIGFPSERTMRRMIRDIGCPAIENVFHECQKEVRTMAKNVAKPDGIAVSIDGQYDHPGFNATNCKVTVLDANLKVVLAASSLNKKEAEIDGKSIRMESVGALRAMRELVADVCVTDQNAMVDKKLREHPDTASIEGAYDWWHVQKPLKKIWRTEMKSSPILSQLYSPFFNHLFYCHKKYDDMSDRPKALELVRSYLNHVQGKHTWKKGGDFVHVFKCDHEALKRKKKGEPARPKLKADSEEFKTIKKMLYSKTFEKAFLKSSPLIDTALNENFHALSLISPFFYDIKMKLSILHYNSLIMEEQQGQREEKRAFVLHRPGRVALSVKRKRDSGKHEWKNQILKECVEARANLEEGRFMERIGMPEDYVFDELMEWENAQSGEDDEEGEEDEEEYGEDEEEWSERSLQL